MRVLNKACKQRLGLLGRESNTNEGPETEEPGVLKLGCQDLPALQSPSQGC